MSNSYPPGGPYDQQGYPPPGYQQGYPQPGYVQPTYVYAGFWRRVLALIIDAIILNIALEFLGNAMGLPTPMSLLAMSDMSPAQMQALMPQMQALMPQMMSFNLSTIAVTWLYFALMESSSWQATLGKKALGMIVTDYAGRRLGFGQATGRHFGKWLSGFILGIGFLMVAFTRRKQGLHDMVASTLVVRRIG